LVNPKNVKKFKGLRLKTQAELEGECEVQEKVKTIVDDRSEMIQQLKQQQYEIELYKTYINATKVIQNVRRNMVFVESLVYDVYESKNPMDVITKTKNYEPDCSSKEEPLIEDDVFKIVF
jgi:ribosomal protein S10